MIFIFYFLAALLIFLSYKSFRGGIDYFKFFSQEIIQKESDFTPFVSVIVPCRGLDEDLEKNLSALFRQDFPHYEVIFVIDSETDEAFSVIGKVLRSKAEKIVSKIVVAGKAVSESQKVHNLREAVLHIAEESEIIVFVDSDARPSSNWLKALIAPLKNEKIGASTSYRWFISKKFSFASEMRSVWNASIASALGPNTKSNFCWGGSMAIRRETFEKIKMRERWCGTLSDDFAVTRTMNENGLEIFFVPRALTVSVGNCNFQELLEFTTRQMKITRVYAPHLWKKSFVGAALFNLVFVWAGFNLFFAESSSFVFWFSLVSVFLISIFSIGKSHWRLKAVRLVLKDYENDLKKQRWTQNTLWILTPALFFYNAFCAWFSRKICWRGIQYELKSPTQTLIISEKL
jgi:cellulose synthase/poly-beta-1,6-N-acetylglucosamine synthase-like glycosyltransferase